MVRVRSTTTSEASYRGDLGAMISFSEGCGTHARDMRLTRGEKQETLLDAEHMVEQVADPLFEVRCYASYWLPWTAASRRPVLLLTSRRRHRRGSFHLHRNVHVSCCGWKLR